MSDVITNVQVGVSGVNNGSLITFVRETGQYERLDPLVNAYVPSGNMFTRLENRFDEHYGGGAT